MQFTAKHIKYNVFLQKTKQNKTNKKKKKKKTHCGGYLRNKPEARQVLDSKKSTNTLSINNPIIVGNN